MKYILLLVCFVCSFFAINAQGLGNTKEVIQHNLKDTVPSKRDTVVVVIEEKVDTIKNVTILYTSA